MSGNTDLGKINWTHDALQSWNEQRKILQTILLKKLYYQCSQVVTYDKFYFNFNFI